MRTRRPRSKKKGFRPFRLVLLLFVGAGIIAYLLSLPIFEIKEVVVNGAKMLDPDQVRTLAAIPLGENLFYVDLGRSRANLQKINAVKTIKFFRLPPSTILINVTERQPVASLIFPNRSVFIDEDGYILNQNDNLKLDMINLAELAVVTGLSERAVMETSQVDKEMAGLVLQLITRLKQFLPGSHLQIDLASFDNISFQLDDLLLVRLGSTDQLARKMEVFEGLLPQVAGKWPEVTYIDVRLPDCPVIRFR